MPGPDYSTFDNESSSSRARAPQNNWLDKWLPSLSYANAGFAALTAVAYFVGSKFASNTEALLATLTQQVSDAYDGDLSSLGGKLAVESDLRSGLPARAASGFVLNGYRVLFGLAMAWTTLQFVFSALSVFAINRRQEKSLVVESPVLLKLMEGLKVAAHLLLFSFMCRLFDQSLNIQGKFDNAIAGDDAYEKFGIDVNLRPAFKDNLLNNRVWGYVTDETNPGRAWLYAPLGIAFAIGVMIGVVLYRVNKQNKESQVNERAALTSQGGDNDDIELGGGADLGAVIGEAINVTVQIFNKIGATGHEKQGNETPAQQLMRLLNGLARADFSLYSGVQVVRLLNNPSYAELLNALNIQAPVQNENNDNESDAQFIDRYQQVIRNACNTASAKIAASNAAAAVAENGGGEKTITEVQYQTAVQEKIQEKEQALQQQQADFEEQSEQMQQAHLQQLNQEQQRSEWFEEGYNQFKGLLRQVGDAAFNALQAVGQDAVVKTVANIQQEQEQEEDGAAQQPSEEELQAQADAKNAETAIALVQKQYDEMQGLRAQNQADLDQARENDRKAKEQREALENRVVDLQAEVAAIKMTTKAEKNGYENILEGILSKIRAGLGLDVGAELPADWASRLKENGGNDEALAGYLEKLSGLLGLVEPEEEGDEESPAMNALRVKIQGLIDALKAQDIGADNSDADKKAKLARAASKRVKKELSQELSQGKEHGGEVDPGVRATTAMTYAYMFSTVKNVEHGNKEMRNSVVIGLSITVQLLEALITQLSESDSQVSWAALIERVARDIKETQQNPDQQKLPQAMSVANFATKFRPALEVHFEGDDSLQVAAQTDKAHEVVVKLSS